MFKEHYISYKSEPAFLAWLMAEHVRVLRVEHFAATEEHVICFWENRDVFTQHRRDFDKAMDSIRGFENPGATHTEFHSNVGKFGEGKRLTRALAEAARKRGELHGS